MPNSVFEQLLVILFFLVALFALECGLGLLVVLVASGFGYSLPFWPVVGAIFIFSLLLGRLRS